MKRTIALFALSSMLLFFVAEADSSPSESPGTRVVIDGVPVVSDTPPMMLNDRVFLPVRSFSEYMDAHVLWRHADKQAIVTTAFLDVLSMNQNSNLIHINQKRYKLDASAFLHRGRVYLPVRLVGEINHASVSYTPGKVTITTQKRHVVQSGETVHQIASRYHLHVDDLMTHNQLSDRNLTPGRQLKIVIPYVMKWSDEKIELLARLIEAEAKGESYRGKLAVGNVVVNRVNSPSFPDTIRDVIYQTNQFTPVRNGKLDVAIASYDSTRAAKASLMGEKTVGDALFFYNPKKTTSTFFRKLDVMTVIGNHTFLK